MLVFRDIVSDDDMFSDDLPYELIDDCLYEVTCDYIADPGDGEGGDGEGGYWEGGDGEGGDGEGGDGSGSGPSVLNIVANLNLKQVRFTRAEYRTYLKRYAGALRRAWNEAAPQDADLDDYVRKFQAAVKMILPKLDDVEFYMGASVNEDAMVALLEYRNGPDGEVPVMMFYKHGLTRMEI
jgi:hypothetical protein